MMAKYNKDTMVFDYHDKTIIADMLNKGIDVFNIEPDNRGRRALYFWGDDSTSTVITHRLAIEYRTVYYDIHDIMEGERYVKQQFIHVTKDGKYKEWHNQRPQMEKYVIFDNRIYATVIDNGKTITIEWQVNNGNIHHGIMETDEFPTERDVKEYVRSCIGYCEPGYCAPHWKWDKGFGINNKSCMHGCNID